MFKKSFLIATALCALVLCLLAGCSSDPKQTEPGVVDPSVNYTVRFWIGTENVKNETVSAGERPQSQIPVPDGLTIAYWKDSAGNAVDPSSTKLTANADYYAMVYPALTEHAPYLFADENGRLRPDEALNTLDFTEAMNALATDAARAYFPDMPKLSREMDGEELVSSLAFFFPRERVEAAFPDAGERVTRAAFAKGMNTLLGRGASETAAITGKAALFPDLGADTSLWSDLLEAAIEHAPSEGGKAITDAFVSSVSTNGFFNIGGWLYYADADGNLARNTDVGELHFDENGRYTSGDAELDAIVAGILDGIIRDNPDLTGLDLLRKAFEYCRDSFMYLRKEAFPFGATGWETERAKEMFQKGLGNCYNYAASFWALSRGLGYEAVAISGTMLHDPQPHSWVEIPWEGEMRICDVEEEMYYRTEREDYSYDMFFLTYEEGTYWTYARP